MGDIERKLGDRKTVKTYVFPELLPCWVSESQKLECDSLSETTAPAGGPLHTAPSGEPCDLSSLDFLQASG